MLEALGVNIHLNAEQARQCLDSIGICFLFAQIYHPSMKHAAAPRRELGVRTVFNMLGPLTNPAGADLQLMGIYDRNKTETVANVLKELGSKRAMIVSSLDGLDEISISAPTQVSELKDGAVFTYEVTPEEMGLSRHPLEDVLGGDAAENAAIITAVLAGEVNPYRDIVLVNAGACIYVAGLADTLRDGVEKAREVVDSGAALLKLEQLKVMTKELDYVS